MDVNKIIKKLKPLLERGDKGKIAEMAGVDAQAVYLTYQLRHKSVKESIVHKILAVTVDYLRSKTDYKQQLEEKLKGL